MNSKLLLAIFFTINLAFSQNDTNSEIVVKEKDSVIIPVTNNNYRWRLDIGFGESKGIRPYSDGYYASNSQKLFGTININSVSVGATYVFSKLISFKMDLAFDRFKDYDNKSIPFEVAQFRTSLQGVFNLNSLFSYQKEDSRFVLLAHGGISVSTLQKIKSEIAPKVGSRELNGGVVFGFTPMYRITKKSYIYLDLASFTNFRQHYTWDGQYAKPSNNLAGQMINGTLGITYSLGKRLEWLTKEENKLKEKNEELEKRVGDLEIMMNDTDKDGVPDYLDFENNSVAGVAVDTRGVMVDLNKNGVPDELERYFEKTYGNQDTTKSSKDSSATTNTQSSDFLEHSINEGYITVFFDSNRSKPSNSSMLSINFIIKYLKANPSVSMDITGYSDKIGNEENNNKLALARANSVKKILVESGIDGSKLITASAGVDTTIDSNSNEVLRYVRRVTFKIKK